MWTKLRIHESYLNTLGPVGNKDRCSDWKGTFLCLKQMIKSISSNIMCCHSSIKCFTQPFPGLVRGGSTSAVGTPMHSSLKSENSWPAHIATCWNVRSEGSESENMAFTADVLARQQSSCWSRTNKALKYLSLVTHHGEHCGSTVSLVITDVFYNPVVELRASFRTKADAHYKNLLSAMQPCRKSPRFWDT